MNDTSPVPSEETATTNLGRTSEAQENISALTGGAILGEQVVYRHESFVLKQGAPAEVKLNVHNREGKTTNYTVVVQLVEYNRTTADGGDSSEVTDRETLSQRSLTLDSGTHETVVLPVTVNETGTNYLFWYYLYKSEPPETPTPDTAVRSFWMQLNVRATLPANPTETASIATAEENSTDSIHSRERHAAHPRS